MTFLGDHRKLDFALKSQNMGFNQFYIMQFVFNPGHFITLSLQCLPNFTAPDCPIFADYLGKHPGLRL